MASEETSFGLEMSNTPLELRFVDHVECKIQSPEKEIISPTRESIKNPLLQPFTGENGNEMIGKEPEMISGGIIEEGNESKNSDSGLDFSNASSETTEEHFVDRQESYASVDKPESLTSPNKTVDKLFNFLNSESSQSLDALNNNSEVIVIEDSDDESERDNTQTATKDVYLGKEVDLHEGKADDANSAQDKAGDDSAMNLYWYTSNLDVDVAELEAFKESQAENMMSENVVSNLQVTVGNGYYKTKIVDVDLEADNQIKYKSETSFDIKTVPDKRESWSQAFESASSRILDLASELKSDPKVKKNRENESIKDAFETDAEKHPWGLDYENKVRTEIVKEANDELPDIGTIADTVNESKPMQAYSQIITQEHRPSDMGSQRVEEDVTDAVGYMELDETPVEQTHGSVSGITAEDSLRLKSQEYESIKMVEDDFSEDVADAVGYIELKDRPVEDVRVTQQSLSEACQSEIPQVTVTTSGTNTAVTSPENQMMQYKSSEKNFIEKRDVDHSEDVADAVGYMELKDKPVEQMYTASDQAVLQTSAQQTTDSNVNKNSIETSFRSLESQVIGVEVNGNFEMESDQRSQTSEGKDVPDAGLVQIEKVETANLQSPVQITVAEKEKVKAKPFDPFSVKRKYLITANSEDMLQNIGGVFLETETLIDEYLDDKNYSLTLSDCWLRLRNKKFEMKINAAFGVGPNKSPSVEMLTNENEIQEMLMKKYARKLEQKRRVSERQLDVLIDALDISEFVTFETSRRKYQMNDFIVTLDVTNFGFQVGEIEIVANSLTEMIADLVNMDALAVKLGMIFNYSCMSDLRNNNGNKFDKKIRKNFLQ